MTENDRFVRLPEVTKITSLRRTAIRRRMDEGTFPKSVNMGGGVIVWYESEIRQWMANLPRKDA